MATPDDLIGLSKSFRSHLSKTDFVLEPKYVEFADIHIELTHGTKIMLRNLNGRLQRSIKTSLKHITRTLMNKYLISKDCATVWLQEFHKYLLILCYLNPKSVKIVPSRTIEKVWRTYVEHTSPYQEL